MTSLSSLLLVGCGKMGGALLASWQRAFYATNFDVIEPAYNTSEVMGFTLHPNLDSLPKDYTPAVIVFAVKPQNLAEILPQYRARFGDKPLYISIAAGKDIKFLSEHLGANAPIVRAMPNLPAMVGRGMIALSATASVPEAARKNATALMQAAGKVQWMEEAMMDAVTALSGSGPAYVFLFLDALAKAGVAAGLPEAATKTFALETLAGSCELARAGKDSFEQLRKNVTSPGGTTEAALAVLMKDDAFEKLVREAVLAAKKRSEELK